MDNKSRVIFLTTANLATNPRLVKELQLAVSIFDEIHVVEFSIGGWSDDVTKVLKLDFPRVDFTDLQGTRKPWFRWLVVTFLEKFLLKINMNLLNVKYLSYSLNKRTIILKNYISKLRRDYCWVIAHNPGAFYPALLLSKKSNCKLGLDIEDFHPGEFISFSMSERMLKMMNFILPKADYCSFSAPLIQKEIEFTIPKSSKRWFTIINGFPQAEFKQQLIVNSEKIKIVWFSQNITPGRGLEKFIGIIPEFSDIIELHLIGDLSLLNKNLLFQSNSSIIIHPPMKQNDLHEFLSTFHVGLAIDPPLNRNRELAITNKLLAYAQAGLFIISISAQGQSEFLEQSGLNFKILENEENQIKQCLNGLVEYYRKDKLDSRSQFDIAKKYSWESMNSELIKVWKE